MQQKATVGRTVHFHPVTSPPLGRESTTEQFYRLQPRAAIITSIRQEGATEGNPPGDGSFVDLSVFEPNSAHPLPERGVWFSETPKPGHWSWPTKV
jgi:hypothetical protein